jgi:hypothetical protein
MGSLIKIQKDKSGFSVIDGLVVLLIIIAVVLIGYFIATQPKKSKLKNSSNTTTSTNAQSPAQTSGGPYAILSPATVPSKTQECDQPLTYSSNGASSPLKCADGDLNIAEWNALAALEPKIMTLGDNASSSQIQATLCTDTSTNIVDAIESNAYQMSALYYGWSFSSDPSVVLSNGTC